MVTTPESTLGLVKVAYETTDNSLSPSPVSAANPLPVSSSAGSGPGIPANYQIAAMLNTGPSNQPLYLGYANAGTAQGSAGWAIKKLGYDANNNVNAITWASVTAGVPASNLVFSSYASYTYS